MKKLVEVEAVGSSMEEGRNRAVYYRDEIKTAMEALREPVDQLEMMIDKDMWPMPSYGDLIYNFAECSIKYRQPWNVAGGSVF